MKKIVALLLIVALALVGCGQTAPQSSAPAPSAPESSAAPALVKIVVGASPVPHAAILAAIKDELAAQGYELDVREYTDYVQPNLAVQSGDLDANYFQHQPYLDKFNAEQKTDIVSIANVHYEPFGIYPGKTASLEALADGAKVAVPNDPTNEARALLLLEAQGLIKMKADAGLNATINDIVENPKNLEIIEVEAAQVPRALPDVEIAVINGNYAIEAGLSVATDALAIEDPNSLAATTFANILAVRRGDENRPELVALVNALKSETVRAFIKDTYTDGGVVPSF